MGKQSKPRILESFGKDKVTPIQIAFIVDRYLCDNHYSETRSIFRNEASSLIANSPINEVPKSLLSLGEMLDEYICLKEQKVMMDQERVFLEQEKNRVQMLLQGMQNVMHAYNVSRSLHAPNVTMAPDVKSAVVPQLRNVPTTTTMQNTSSIHSLPQSINTNAENGNFSARMMNVSDRRRKDIKAVDAPSSAKKSRGRSSNRKIPVQGQNTLPQSDNAANNQVAQPASATQSSPLNCISSVAKCLFNQPSLPIRTTNSSVPKTPTDLLRQIPLTVIHIYPLLRYLRLQLGMKRLHLHLHVAV